MKTIRDKSILERAKWLTNYLEQYLDEVTPYEFYRFLFPKGSFEEKGKQIDGKYNGIARVITNDYYMDYLGKEKRNIKRYIITDELAMIMEIIATNKDEFVVFPPVGYAGKKATQENARELYALAFDLDGINIQEFGEKTNGMQRLFRKIELGILPEPTFFVMSGTGLHLYFVFEKPVKMYPNYIQELTKLKNRLTLKFWYGDISYLDSKVQIEPVLQPFRAVGTATKIGTKVRAFSFSQKKITVEYLNSFVNEEDRANLDGLAFKNTYSLAEAKELFPKWYHDRVVNGEKKGYWIFNRGLYESWLSYLKNPNENYISFGRRYWAVFTLAAAAKKCGISREELEEDAYALVPILDAIADEEFTDEDVASAMKAYSEDYYTLSVKWINSKFNNILPKTRRNGRKQKEHLERARIVQKIDYPNGEWRNREGRPKGSGTKQEIVKNWREKNPNGKKMECHRDTGLSRVTINKWWE